MKSEKVRTHSNISVCSNLSVWYSIKKAATVSPERQKSFKATANFNCCGSPFIFAYSDAIFDRQNLIRLALWECEAPLYVIFVCGEFYAQVRDLPLPIPLIYANFDKQRLNFDNAFYIKHEHA